jgi:mono/diheme cytochrome c family protein
VNLAATLVPLAAKKVGISGQQTVGAVIVAVVLAGFVLYFITTIRRRDPGAPPGSEIELAPNRKPYYDDDVLEGVRLDRALLFALGMLILIAIALPLYWLFEPTRQAAATVGFDRRSVERGSGLFALTTDPRPGLHFGCAGCHGANGVGGSTTYVISDPAHPNVPPRTVSWAAPPLNTVAFRFTDDELLQIITYGRAGTPMPPWGINGGGAMDDQQLQDVIAYIHSIQLKPDAAKAYWQQQAETTARNVGSVDGAGNPVITGQVLFDTNCARCHTKGYSYGEPQQPGGGGQYGPNITNGSELRQFPNPQDQIDFVTNGVDPGKGYGTGGIMTDFGGGMPHFGGYLSQQEIASIVAYERTL